MITGQQRYKNAMTKARIIWMRAIREFRAGRADEIPALLDIERRCVIAALSQ